MTKVICFLNDDNIYFDCTGHSDYKNPETENNDVCVAVSTLCCMLIRFAESKGIHPDICEDGHVLFKRTIKDKSIASVFNAAMLQMRALAHDYPKYIKVY